MKKNNGVWKNYFKMVFGAGLPWGLLIICFLLSLGVATLTLLFASAMATALTNWTNLSDAITPLFIVFLIGVSAIPLKVIGAHLKGIVTAKVDRNIQRYAAKKVFYLKASDVGDGDPRELITRLTEDTCKTGPFIIDLMINEIPRIYYIIGALIQVAQIGKPILTGSLLLTVPIIIFGSYIAGLITFIIRNKIQKQIADLTSRLSEKVDNIETIKAYGTENREIEDGDKIIMELDRVKRRGAVVTQVTNFIRNMLMFIPLILIIVPPAVLLFKQEITQASFYAYVVLAMSFRSYTAEHLDLWVYLKDAQGATRRLSGLLSLENEMSAAGTELARPGDIEFNDVVFSYGEGLALDHVSFTLEKGKKTAIVGISASGKSTILNLIEKFYSAQSGEICLDGTDIAQMDYTGYRSLFTYLPQNAPAFTGTVRDMLNYSSPEPHGDEELIEALKKVDLYDDLAEIGCLDFEIGSGAGKLSMGQKQKLGAARMLLSDTEFVMLDEATSALDNSATEKVQKAIDEACIGRTQIIVSHDLRTVQNADKILVFNEGKLVAQGRHDDLIATCPFYQELAEKEVAA